MVIDVGERARDALVRMPEWMHRRVEATLYSETGVTRLRVSLDVTVPREHWPMTPSGDPILILGLVRKGALTGLDTRDATGAPLPVLTKKENCEVACSLLLALVADALGIATAREARIVKLVEDLVAAPPPAQSAASAFSALTGALRSTGKVIDIAKLQTLLEYAFALEGHFLFAVQIPQELTGKRTVVKYSYDMSSDIPRELQDGTSLRMRLVAYGDAASYHLEVTAPPGVLVGKSRLDEYLGAHKTSLVDEDSRVAMVRHLSSQPSSRATYGIGTISLHPRRSRLTQTAFYTALIVPFVTFALLSLQIGVWLEPVNVGASSAVPVVVSVAAAIIQLTGARVEHPFAALLLRQYRLVVTWTYALLLLLALGVSLALPTEVTEWLLFAVCIAQMIVLVFATRAQLHVRAID